MLRSLFNSFVVPRLGNYCFLLWIHGYGVVIRFGFKSDDDYSELIRESQFWSCDFFSTVQLCCTCSICSIGVKLCGTVEGISWTGEL